MAIEGKSLPDAVKNGDDLQAYVEAKSELVLLLIQALAQATMTVEESDASKLIVGVRFHFGDSSSEAYGFEQPVKSAEAGHGTP